MATTIPLALYETLTGDSDLTDLLATPTSVYHQVAPQDARYPLVVTNRQAGTKTRQFGAHIKADVWLVKAISEGPSATRAELIAARIDHVLDGASLTVDDTSVLAVLGEDDVSYLELDGPRQFHHEGATYRVQSEAA